MIRSYPAVTGQEDGVALDVAVDDALSVQVAQSPQHRQAHRRDLLLVHPARRQTPTCQHITASESRRLHSRRISTVTVELNNAGQSFPVSDH